MRSALKSTTETKSAGTNAGSSSRSMAENKIGNRSGLFSDSRGEYAQIKVKVPAPQHSPVPAEVPHDWNSWNADGSKFSPKRSAFLPTQHHEGAFDISSVASAASHGLFACQNGSFLTGQVDTTFVFALVWSCGALLNEDGRRAFEAFIRSEAIMTGHTIGLACVYHC